MRKKNTKSLGKPYPLPPERTVHYSRKKNLQPIPNVGQVYHCFDDGKVRFSRLYLVEVIETLGEMEFKRKYPEEFKNWLEISKSHYWLYSRSTDKFVVANCKESNEHPLGIFVRTKQGGWFGIGDWFNSGLLDVTGELYKDLVKSIDNFDYSDEEKKRLIEEYTI